MAEAETMNDMQIAKHIQDGAVVHWDRGAVLHEMPITFPVSWGGPVYSGTVGGCVRECLKMLPRPMSMLSMSIDVGTIEGLPGGLIMQQALMELAKREDYPG